MKKLLGILVLGLLLMSGNAYAKKIKVVSKSPEFIIFKVGKGASDNWGNNYIMMKTCKSNNWSCVGLRVGNSEPGTVKRPCKSGAGSASNSAYHFVFNFNNSDFKNPYNLDGPTNLSIGGTDPKQCCLAQGWNPRPLGRTHIWGYNNDNRIKIITNIGDKNGNNFYITDYVDWPGTGF